MNNAELVSAPIRTYDVRVWVDSDVPFGPVWEFYEVVRDLAEQFPGIEVRWITQRRDRHRRPRVRAPCPSVGVGSTAG